MGYSSKSKVSIKKKDSNENSYINKLIEKI